MYWTECGFPVAIDEENRKISLSIRALLDPVAQEEAPAEEAAEEATDNE